MTSVIVPAFNEGHVIQKTVAELARVLDSCLPAYEIIVVNDGSSDNTSAKVAELAERDARVRLEAYSPNRGKGYALRRGFKVSRGETIVFFDADLDIPAECTRVLLELLEASDLDGIVGSKIHKDSVVHYPFARRLFSRLVHLFVWMLLRIQVKDTQVGLKVFRRPVLNHIMHLPQVDGFAFDVELLALAQKAGFNIGEGPVTIQYRQFGSTVGPSSIVRALIDTLGVFYRVRIQGVGSVNGRK